MFNRTAVSLGVSFGVAPLLLCEYLNLASTDVSFYLIDPYEGSETYLYNRDVNEVKRHWNNEIDSHWILKRCPEAFPIEGLQGIAFAHINTGNRQAELDSLDYLYSNLLPGGIIVLDTYGWNPLWQPKFDHVLGNLGANWFTSVTGQAMIFRPFKNDSLLNSANRER